MFKRSISTNGKYKQICVTEDGIFVNPETGDVINVVSELYNIYGDTPFDLSTSCKVDEDLD